MKKQKVLIPGIGHKVKSKFNPDARCEIIDQIAQTFPSGSTTHYQFARSVEQITLTKKANLILNVDGAIAALLLDLLVSMEFTHSEIQQYIDAGLFNAFFIAARTIGFLGHALDQKRLNEGLYRTNWDDIRYQE
jgi:citrate synthase